MSDEELKICTKRRYETELEARKMIAHLIIAYDKVDLSTYKCHICSNYHLTSKSQRKRK